MGSLVVALCGISAATSTSSQAAPTPPSASSEATPTVTQNPPPQSVVVGLLSGERVLIGPGEGLQRQLTPMPPPGTSIATPMRVLRLPGHTYAVPTALAPVVGNILDLSLFDLDQLARHPDRPLGVRLTFRPHAKTATVPGVVITARNGRTATGVVTPRSSLQLHRALRSTSSRALFRNLSRLTTLPVLGARPSNVGPQPSQGIRRRFPMRTLTLRVRNASGGPFDWGWNNAFGGIVNVDNAKRFSGTLSFNLHGVAKVSVPDGHYYIDISVYDANEPGVTREVIRNTVTVRADRTVILDAAKATVQITGTADQPTVGRMWGMAYGRTDAPRKGGAGGLLIGSPDYPVFVTPFKASNFGTALLGAFAQLVPSVNSEAWSYDLFEFLGDHIGPSPIVLTGDRSQLETVHDRLYSPIAGTQGSFARTLGNTDTVIMSVPLLVRTPGEHTSYVSTSPGVQFGGGYLAPHNSSGPWPPQQLGQLRDAVPGATSSVDWGKGPTHISWPEYDIGPFTECAACASAAGNLTLFSFPYGDSDPSHVGWPYPLDTNQGGNWTATNGGVLLAQGLGSPSIWGGFTTVFGSNIAIDATTYGAIVGSATPSVVTSHWEVPVSTISQAAPAHWWCWPFPFGGGGCTVIPFIRVDYDLPLSWDNSAPSGPFAGKIRISQIDRTQPVTGLSCSIAASYDGGTSWSTAPTVSDGTTTCDFTLQLPPATGAPHDVALRVSASDAAGRVVTETITAAFTVAP